MKTKFTRNNIDNIATAALVAASLFALASGIITSNPVAANYATDLTVQTLDTIVVTASRAPDATLGPIVVTASRKVHHA